MIMQLFFYNINLLLQLTHTHIDLKLIKYIEISSSIHEFNKSRKLAFKPSFSVHNIHLYLCWQEIILNGYCVVEKWC